MFKKILLVLLTSSFTLFACDANCVACHPKLLKNGKMDADHKILKKCTKCHTAKENEESHGACGVDCWKCHSISKVSEIDIPEHKVLPRCIKCHASLDEKLLNIGSIKEGTFSGNSLQDSIRGLQ